MGMYSITGWSGGGRRPLTYNLKAGQFRGMGRVNVIPNQTTIINNNIINGGYGIYDNHQCCNGGTPKWLNWMMGIGIGTSLLGGILSLFGIGNNNGAGTVEGAGGKEESQETKAQDPTQSKEYKDLNKKLDKALDEIAELKKQSQAYQARQAEPLDPVKEETPEVQETPEDIGTNPKQDYSNIKNGARMVCTDASGRTKDISGTLSNVQTDANGVPKSFTLTDSSSGNKYQYEVRVGSDGTLSYQCVSKNGQATIGAPTYSLKDGKLVNEQSQNGFGQGIKTQSAPAQTVTKQNQTATSQNQIKTLADGTMVSDNFTAVTPYEHSDGKYYSKEEEFKTPWSNFAQQSTQATTKKSSSNNSAKAKINYNINSGLLRSNGSGQVTVNGKTYTFKPDRSFDNKEDLQAYIKNGLLAQIKKDNPNFAGELE